MLHTEVEHKQVESVVPLMLSVAENHTQSSSELYKLLKAMYNSHSRY